MSRLTDDLNVLHDHYVESVNIAVGDNDLDRADRLAAAYDEEAILMIAIHEGRTDMLPFFMLRHPATATRSSIPRLFHSPRAA